MSADDPTRAAAELLPCPFCGDEDVEVLPGPSVGGTCLYMAVCHACGAEGPYTVKGERHALKLWNDRWDGAERIRQLEEALRPFAGYCRQIQHGATEPCGKCPECLACAALAWPGSEEEGRDG